MYPVPKLGVLLLIGLCLAHGENQCPAPTDIYPCKCHSKSLGLEIECNGSGNVISIEDLQKSLNRMSRKKIQVLDLYQFNLGQAPSELFNGLAIQELYLRETNITEMPALTGSENTLQKLTFGVKAISKQSIQNFTVKVNHLIKLKTFMLVYNTYLTRRFHKTIDVSNDWFENGPSSLEKVDISFNDAESFGDRVFSELLNLKELNLEWNGIEEVYRSMFPDPAKRLLSIYLQGNIIESLPEDTFSHMPVLEKVDVSENFISFLDDRTWRPVWEQLEYLNFGEMQTGSRITCDSTIFWTFDLSRPRRLLAKCNETDKSYKEYRGRTLAEIIDEKQGISNEN